MFIAGRHTMYAETVPSVFSLLAIKFLADRAIYNSSNLLSGYDTYQLSELQFLDGSNTKFVVPGNATMFNYRKYNGRITVTYPPVKVSVMNEGQNWGRLFDNSTSTKMYQCDVGGLGGSHSAHFDISDTAHAYPLGVDADTVYGNTLTMHGYANDRAARTALYGTDLGSPISVIINLAEGGAEFDLARWTKWCFYNANDNNSQTGRTWVWGEILGSANGKTWWLLDSFKDPSIPNTNYALAYTGDLFIRGKGDLFSDLDLAERFS